jgi:hypothetical protein
LTFLPGPRFAGFNSSQDNARKNLVEKVLNLPLGFRKVKRLSKMPGQPSKFLLATTFPISAGDTCGVKNAVGSLFFCNQHQNFSCGSITEPNLRK